MPSLPPQRAAVLAFLQEQAQAGVSPSLAEIAQAFGFASRNAAQKHVQALADAGLIELLPNQKRGIRLPGGAGRDALLALPVLGRVAAGLPIGADIGLERQLWLDRALFSLRPDYLLQVQGDSMIDDGILMATWLACIAAMRRATDRSWWRGWMAKSPSSAWSAAPNGSACCRAIARMRRSWWRPMPTSRSKGCTAA